MSTIGWIGAILFAFCSLPQAIKIFQTHKTSDISWLFLTMWFFGEIFSFVYVLFTEPLLPILFNYFFNFIILVYIMVAKYHYDRD